MIMIKWILAVVLCVFGTISAQEKNVQVLPVDANKLEVRKALPLSIEHSLSQEDTVWGLMQRETLPDSSGMLFYYDAPCRITIWSLNCLINLSVAFLDCDGIIRELRDLYAFPEKMCQLPPLNSAADVLALSPYNPVVRFFMSRAIRSNYPAKYAYETNIRWFQENGVKVGDVISWDGTSGTGWLSFTFDASCLKPSFNQAMLVIPEDITPVSLWLARDNQGRDVAFLDGEGRILKAVTLPGGASFAAPFRPVAISDGPVSGIVIAQPGWLQANGLYNGVELKMSY